MQLRLVLSEPVTHRRAPAAGRSVTVAATTPRMIRNTAEAVPLARPRERAFLHAPGACALAGRALRSAAPVVWTSRLAQATVVAAPIKAASEPGSCAPTG